MVTTLQEKQIQAQNLQERGLLRRALALWNEIARSDDSELMPLARDKQQEIAALLAQQKVEKEAAKYHCRSHVEADRQCILTYLRNGLKPREIEGLTRRSSAFIYSCKKLLAGE
ncbi:MULTISPECIES: hypothetical protein [Klebsiella]|uniref:PerC family transcriptional regulator n=1 Tax=Klebsiella electrica TaxID=1259973 RepID=A0AAJ5QPQ6_9ENTR|nr:hypothetical protein [Klebsiella electrica]PJR61745.1 hypothetical protein CWM52_16000 [Raoultella sp. T31]QDI09375.1 hypothetical protein electrica_03283 [Klebsiella electrica]WBW59658.1 hypothetical protein OR613_16645 [Klebsiella electrica]BBV77236.1 hypothetical protein STW0522RAO56_32900 [Raoultella planticola]